MLRRSSVRSSYHSLLTYVQEIASQIAGDQHILVGGIVGEGRGGRRLNVARLLTGREHAAEGLGDAGEVGRPLKRLNLTR
jgi:hypothetical protein